LIENNFAIPIWWAVLQTSIRAILNKNIGYDSVEDPHADSSIPFGRYRSASLVASLQLSALHTLLSICQSQFLSSSHQSLHFFSCPSIENGIIFGSLFPFAFKCLSRLCEFPLLMIRFTAMRCVSSYGELFSSLRRQDSLQEMTEVRLFSQHSQETLNDTLMHLWLTMINKEKYRDDQELLREAITGIVRYGSLDSCHSLQLILHSKLNEDPPPPPPPPPTTRSADSSSSVIALLTEKRRREYTRGLLLCSQRNYFQTLQIIATTGGQTFVDLAQECGERGGRGGEGGGGGEVFFKHLWSPSELVASPSESNDEKTGSYSAMTHAQVLSNWLSHLSGSSRSPLNLGGFLDIQQYLLLLFLFLSLLCLTNPLPSSQFSRESC
jgi:hypothetical protein